MLDIKLNFAEKTKNSLSGYKRNFLGIGEDGYYKYRGCYIPKSHILPHGSESLNIIASYRKEFLSSQAADINFHKYFHHLNSSQALCINLFYPLVFERRFDVILDLLKISKQPVTKTHFEKESDLEAGSGRKTNFDFYMQLADNTEIFFEIKYTETEFGKAKKDAAHKEKFKATYKPLVENNYHINPEYREMNQFLDSYQIMRNVCHITDKSYVVFVYPEGNEKIRSQAQLVGNRVLTEKGKKRFKILTLESTVCETLKREQKEKLQAHFNEFKFKYLKYEE